MKNIYDTPEISSSSMQPVTNCDRFNLPIENRIMTLRSKQVMIDRDLAELYGVETKRLNEQVKRNIERFPENFRFQLSTDEKNELVANCDRFEILKHSASKPYAFTEQGVAMLSAVLKSETAIKTSIRIIEAFVAMRNFLMNNAALFQRMDRIEFKQLKTDEKIDAVLNRLKTRENPSEGIFYDGQIFDAYMFISKLIKEAKESIVIIDNYIDDSVLLQLAKRNKNVKVDIYCAKISEINRQDVQRHNAQYPGVTLHNYKKAHDRFLIIDETVYHIGHSLKDLGKKIFAFSRMEAISGSQMLSSM